MSGGRKDVGMTMKCRCDTKGVFIYNYSTEHVRIWGVSLVPSDKTTVALW